MLIRTVVAVTAALMLAAPSFAGDIVSMPTGNVVQPGNIELNGIYWSIPSPAGLGESTSVGELFVGVYDRLELDVLYADVDGLDSFTEVNGYLTLVKETASHPSLIVGATNLAEDDWLAGSDQASVFVLSSYNLAAPPVPSWSTPLVRAHVGWGDEFHGQKVFVGIQVKASPQLGAAWTYYRHKPGWMATYAPLDWLELTAGTIGGDAFYRAGGFLSW